MIARSATLASTALCAVCITTFALAAPPPPRPMFTTIPADAPWHRAPLHPAGQLTQWNGSFTDQHGLTVTYTMVGTDPTTTNATTTTPVVIIPIKMVYGPLNGNMTFDPKHTVLPNGRTVVRNTRISPLFTSGITFVQGGVNLGKTQYIDAFQRENFRSSSAPTRTITSFSARPQCSRS